MAGIANMKDSTKVYLKDLSADAPVWEKVGNVAEISELGGDGAEDIDVTCLDSEAKEYEAGFEESGEVTITINVTDAEKTAQIKGYKANKTDLELAVTVENKKGVVVSTDHCAGYIKSVKTTGLNVGGVIQLSVVFKVSGEWDSEFTAPEA